MTQSLMKMRHAAVLALVGWYLMGPPLDTKNGVIYFDTPISAWSTAGVFDAAAECTKRRDALIAQDKEDDKEYAKSSPPVQKEFDAGLDKALGTPAGVGRTIDFSRWVKSYRCIATDDPRLRTN